MIQDRLSDVLGELSRTLVAAYQIPNALARLCAQLGVQPDHALEYLQRTSSPAAATSARQPSR